MKNFIQLKTALEAFVIAANDHSKEDFHENLETAANALAKLLEVDVNEMSESTLYGADWQVTGVRVNGINLTVELSK